MTTKINLFPENHSFQQAVLAGTQLRPQEVRDVVQCKVDEQVTAIERGRMYPWSHDGYLGATEVETPRQSLSSISRSLFRGKIPRRVLSKSLPLAEYVKGLETLEVLHPELRLQFAFRTYNGNTQDPAELKYEEMWEITFYESINRRTADCEPSAILMEKEDNSKSSLASSRGEFWNHQVTRTVLSDALYSEITQVRGKTIKSETEGTSFNFSQKPKFLGTTFDFLDQISSQVTD